MDEDKPVFSIGNSQVEYKTQKRKKNQVNKTADKIDNTFHQCSPKEVLASSSPSGSNMFNIQLSYKINQALDPELWDSEFCAISLYESMEHLVSNIKNIKESHQRIGKYIKAKSVNTNPNDVKDLNSIGKEI